MKTITFFNIKGGVGKTTLLYHLAWVYAEMGLRIVALDLDPQSHLTSMFLSEDRLDELWNGDAEDESIISAVAPLLEEGTGDVKQPHLEILTENLALVPGNLGLARMEDELSSQWPKCLEGTAKALRITTVFHRLALLATKEFCADLALMDVGPNLGALNRCAIIASDHIAVPLVPDVFSLQGLRNLGPTMNKWRKGWSKRLDEASNTDIELPLGSMQPAGYIVLQHAERRNRPVQAYRRWAERFPKAYRMAMELPHCPDSLTSEDDPYCLARLKHYHSLMPLAMEAGKPMFHLKPADGAIGAHVAAVADCAADFKRLALRMATATGFTLPSNLNISR